MVKTVEVKVTDPKLLEEVDALKEKVRTAETIWNDLEIQNTTLRKQLVSAQQQVQVYEDALWMFMSDPICSQMYLRKVLLACHCATKLIYSSYPPTISTAVVAEGARRSNVDSASDRGCGGSRVVHTEGRLLCRWPRRRCSRD